MSTTTKPRLALVIGHTHGWAEGAQNPTTGLTEWIYNKNLASLIQYLAPEDWDLRVIERPHPGGLPAVVRQVNEYSPRVMFSMHANASGNRGASGAEALYWYRSIIGKQLADLAAAKFAQTLSIRNRGARPVKVGQRGWYVLYHTTCPAVIMEPFFIDNDSDLRKALFHLPKLAKDYLYLFECALRLTS